jgi:selenocysteine-specific elongation factor
MSISPHLRDRALSDAQIEDICERLSIIKAAAGDRVFATSGPVWLQFKRGLMEALQSFHTDNPDISGIGLERLRMQLSPRPPAPAFRSLLQALVRNKEIALDGAWVRLAGHQVRLTPQDEKIWSKVAPLLGGVERFRPPRVRDISTLLVQREPDIRRLLKLVGRMGKADEVAHDHFFLRETVAEMVDIVVDLDATSANGQFTRPS